MKTVSVTFAAARADEVRGIFVRSLAAPEEAFVVDVPLRVIREAAKEAALTYAKAAAARLFVVDPCARYAHVSIRLTEGRRKPPGWDAWSAPLFVDRLDC